MNLVFVKDQDDEYSSPSQVVSGQDCEETKDDPRLQEAKREPETKRDFYVISATKMAITTPALNEFKFELK